MGLPGVVPVPAIGGSDTGGSVMAGTVGLTVGATTTTSVAEPWNESAPLAAALANSSTCSPSAAFALTLTATCSSSAWPAGRLPTLQDMPSGTGQTVKLGAPMYSAQATRAWTVTPVLDPFVLQTQTAKLATCPAFTCDELEKDCTRTHNCGVFGFGGGEDEPLGVGLGLVDGLELGVGLPDDFLLGEGLGLGEWVGLADGLLLVLGLGDGLLLELGLGEGLLLLLVLGLGDGLLLVLGLGDGLLLVLGLAEVLPLFLLLLVLGLAEVLPLFLLLLVFLLLLARALLLVAVGSCARVRRSSRTAVETAKIAVRGTLAQAVRTIGWLVTVAATAWLNRPVVRKAIPATAPTAADLRTCALTPGTSLQYVSRVRPRPAPWFSHYAWTAQRLPPGRNGHRRFINASLRAGLGMVSPYGTVPPHAFCPAARVVMRGHVELIDPPPAAWPTVDGAAV